MTYFPRSYFAARYFPGPYFGRVEAARPHLFFSGRWVENVWLLGDWVDDMDMRAEFEIDVELQGLLPAIALDARWDLTWDFDAEHGLDLSFFGATGMSVKNAKVSMFAGNRRNLNITVKDDAGEVLNLTGYAATFKLLRWINGEAKAPPVLTLSSPSGGISFPTPANGVVRVVIANGATTNFLGAHYWELELTDGSGDTNVVATGLIDIMKNH